jgi:hypothetical protein
MVAASVAVVTLVVWALSRSFNAPVTSSIPVEIASPAAPAPSTTPSNPSEEHVQGPEEAAVVRVSPEDLRQKTLRGEVTVIDVRTAADFQLGHLPGSLHVPLANVEAQIAYLPKGKPIVAYCT